MREGREGGRWRKEGKGTHHCFVVASDTGERLVIGRFSMTSKIAYHWIARINQKCFLAVVHKLVYLLPNTTSKLQRILFHMEDS